MSWGWRNDRENNFFSNPFPTRHMLGFLAAPVWPQELPLQVNEGAASLNLVQNEGLRPSPFWSYVFSSHNFQHQVCQANQDPENKRTKQQTKASCPPKRMPLFKNWQLHRYLSVFVPLVPTGPHAEKTKLLPYWRTRTTAGSALFLTGKWRMIFKMPWWLSGSLLVTCR